MVALGALASALGDIYAELQAQTGLLSDIKTNTTPSP